MLFDIINIGGRPRKGRCVIMYENKIFLSIEVDPNQPEVTRKRAKLLADFVNRVTPDTEPRTKIGYISPAEEDGHHYGLWISQWASGRREFTSENGFWFNLDYFANPEGCEA